jgi:hypothetical protein
MTFSANSWTSFLPRSEQAKNLAVSANVPKSLYERSCCEESNERSFNSSAKAIVSSRSCKP